jgi:hypothetical protein
MFREGGKGFGVELRDVAEEHQKEVDAVKKIHTDVLGMCLVCGADLCGVLIGFCIGGSMPTYVKAPKELRFGKPSRRS